MKELLLQLLKSVDQQQETPISDGLKYNEITELNSEETKEQNSKPKILSRKRRYQFGYVIARGGETCEKIARERDIPSDYVIRANPTLNCYRLKKGDYVAIDRT